jgi:glutaconate CoA-transferase subunit A
VGPISDMLFDQLVAAGCVRRIQAAWVGNVSAGLGHNYRRAVERGIPHPIEVEDHSNLTIAVALQAGAMGAPYVPTRSLLGTGLLQSNSTFKEARDPFSGDPIVLVPALTPDVAILHVQRADAEGHAHCWGTLGVTREAALAAKRVILVAEEIQPRERLLSDPGLVLAPTLKVAAVVHEPFGAYPSPVQGCYRRAHDFYHRYHEESRTEEGTHAWLDRWVHGVKDWTGFLGLLGVDARAAVRITLPRPSEPLNYGA